MYKCISCQMENAVENINCLFCDAARPPMEELIAAEKARLKEEAALNKADQDESEDEGEPLFHIRLNMLRRDLRHMMSHAQKQAIQK